MALTIPHLLRWSLIFHSKFYRFYTKNLTQHWIFLPNYFLLMVCALFKRVVFSYVCIRGEEGEVYTCDWVYLRRPEVSELELQAFVNLPARVLGGPP